MRRALCFVVGEGHCRELVIFVFVEPLCPAASVAATASLAASSAFSHFVWSKVVGIIVCTAVVFQFFAEGARSR